MASSELEQEHEWVENDLGLVGRLMADWRPWPLIVIPPTIGLMLLLQTPLIVAVMGGVILGVIIAVAAFVGERTVVSKLATTKDDLVWLDRAGRLHRVPLWQVQEVQKLRWESQNVVWYLTPDGKRAGVGVGTNAANLVRDALSKRGGP